jgi:hypothetical protein
MASRTRGCHWRVDTNGRTHHAAVIDQYRRLLADAEFGAHTDDYRQLMTSCMPCHPHPFTTPFAASLRTTSVLLGEVAGQGAVV